MNKKVETLEKQIDFLSKKIAANNARLKELESVNWIIHLKAIRDAYLAREKP